MKICPKCGVSQNDSNNLCVDCGAPLGRPLDEDTEYRIERERRERISELGTKLDELQMGRFKLPLLLAFAVCIVGSIVLLLLSGAGMIPFTEQVWLLLVMVFSAIGIFETLFPHFMWKLELLRLSMYIDTSDASPSFYYIFMYKLIVWFCLAVTALCLALLFCGH